MAWSDKPTKNQINAIWYLAMWSMSLPELKEALKWLEDHATRKQVSDELGRVKDLKVERKLTKDAFFEGEIWKDYYYAKAIKEV